MAILSHSLHAASHVPVLANATAAVADDVAAQMMEMDEYAPLRLFIVLCGLIVVLCACTSFKYYIFRRPNHSTDQKFAYQPLAMDDFIGSLNTLEIGVNDEEGDLSAVVNPSQKCN